MKFLRPFPPALPAATLLALFVLFCLTPEPLRAQESPLPEPAGEQTQPKETLPPEPRVYPEDADKITDRFIFMGSINAAYSESKDRDNDDSVSGGFVSGFLAPGYKLSDATSLLVLYNGSYYKQLNFYSDLVGPRGRDERQSHTITPMLRIAFGENRRYALTPSVFYTTTYNKDVEGGDWDDGLYNYRDRGGGLDFSIREMGFGDGDGTLRLGAQYYEREYPNYTSLLDLAKGLGEEEDERDYNAVLAKIAYHWAKPFGFSWGADYYVLYKRLEDKKVVNFNGVLTSDEQRDYLHGLTLRLSYVPEALSDLRLGLDLSGSLYDSNQNYYDGMGTIGLDDDEYLHDFYDYISYRIRPSISYTFPLFPLTASVSYAYQQLDYTERRAQNRNGDYKSDEQYEIQEEITIGLRYALLENLSVFTRYQYLSVDSNNENETVYKYDHIVDYYYAGVSLSF